MEKTDFILLPFLALMAIVGLTSCSTPRTPLNNRYIYTGLGVPAPVITKKGQLSLAFAHTSGQLPFVSSNTDADKSSGFGFKVAYSPINYFYGHVGYYSHKETDHFHNNDITLNNTQSQNSYKRTIPSVGAGFYYPVAKNKFTVNLSTGVEFAKYKSELRGYNMPADYYFNVSNPNIYFTPSIQLTPKPSFNMNFGFRFSGVTYKNIKTNYSDENLQHTQYSALLNRPTYLFVDPYLNMQLGFKSAPYIKLDWSITAPAYTTIPKSAENLKERYIIAQIGICIQPNLLSSKK